MANQYVMLVEETTRGTDPESGYETYPVTDFVEAKPEFNDGPRNEFRGADTALGPIEDVRRSFNNMWTLTAFWYPSSGFLGTLWKHVYGLSSISAAIDTTAYQTNYIPESMPYGTGATLAAKAIGVVPNVDDGSGTTKSRYNGGMRPSESIIIEINPAEDVTLVMPFQGPGQYIGDQATLEASSGIPTGDPYVGSDVTCFQGSGVSVTGSAPDYTEIGEGSMDQFSSDTMTITITTGRSDKEVIDGVVGANLTTRADGSPFKVDLVYTIDFADPASGYSSADEYEAQLTAMQYVPFVIKFTSADLAGSSTEVYEDILYMPRMKMISAEKTLSNTGGQPSVVFTFESRNDETALKPIFHQATNKNSSI